MPGDIINKVAQSGIITLDLSDIYPREEIIEIDLKNWLFQGLIVKEKDFRKLIKTHPWENYNNKAVTLYCSTDAIIPLWAYMLITSRLTPFASTVLQGREEDALLNLFLARLQQLDPSEYEDERVVIKGCSDKFVPPGVYIEITRLLQPVVSSLMFGEPCSTVPVYKKSKKS